MAEVLVTRVSPKGPRQPLGTARAAAPSLQRLLQRPQQVAGPDWLRQRRDRFWERFVAAPAPSSTRDEDWRRTDASRLPLYELLEKQQLRLASPQQQARSEGASADAAQAARGMSDLVPFGDDSLEHSGTIVAAITRQGVSLHGSQQDLEALEQSGVSIVALGSLANMDDTAATRIRQLLSLLEGDGPLSAAWQALWNGGALITAPAGTHLSPSLWIVHDLSGALSVPATLLWLGEDSSLSVCDQYRKVEEGAQDTPDSSESSWTGDGGFGYYTPEPQTAIPTCTLAATLAMVGRGAQLSYGTLQEQPLTTWHVSHTLIQLEQEARLSALVSRLGAGTEKSWFDVNLVGRGSDAEISGIAFASSSQHLDHQSLQRHLGEDTRSRFTLKCAVSDHATSVYSGLIEVLPSAQKTDGYVSNRNLLLDPGAKADSIPRLEIGANDVRCGHGATAGHIDDNERFYMTSRGIPSHEVDRLIVRGFFEDILAAAPFPSIAAVSARLLDEKIARWQHP